MLALAVLPFSLLTPPAQVVVMQRFDVQQAASQLSLRQPTVGTAFLVARGEYLEGRIKGVEDLEFGVSVEANNDAVLALEKAVAEKITGREGLSSGEIAKRLWSGVSGTYTCDGLPCKGERALSGAKSFPTSFGKVVKAAVPKKPEFGAGVAERNRLALAAKAAKDKPTPTQRILSARPTKPEPRAKAKVAPTARTYKLAESPVAKMNKAYLSNKVKNEKPRKADGFGDALVRRAAENRDALARKEAMDG